MRSIPVDREMLYTVNGWIVSAGRDVMYLQRLVDDSYHHRGMRDMMWPGVAIDGRRGPPSLPGWFPLLLLIPHSVPSPQSTAVLSREPLLTGVVILEFVRSARFPPVYCMPLSYNPYVALVVPELKGEMSGP